MFPMHGIRAGGNNLHVGKNETKQKSQLLKNKKQSTAHHIDTYRMKSCQFVAVTNVQERIDI